MQRNFFNLANPADVTTGTTPSTSFGNNGGGTIIAIMA
jgi:hypothetical protein